LLADARAAIVGQKRHFNPEGDVMETPAQPYKRTKLDQLEDLHKVALAKYHAYLEAD